ncbi:NADPH-dependent FMN reductase [Lactiplantibacillus carotarum]|uniref:NADPH-dependent FMN reductase n=1 Tax=Lactiplantibacillus carotarum TaxID=2993456 RepID=UPI00298EE0BA|nr:NAD(P)H-dependent oxidoreductase [Lactiplantibacillus carotarum]
MANETRKPVIGVILGTNRTARIGGAVADWTMSVLKRDEYELKLIDLAEVDLPFLDEPDVPAHGNYQNASTVAFAKIIAACDGFVLVFPQYNWGYPAVLKNALDTLFVEWQDKPVGTVIYGHHSIQADIAIRLVLAGLEMRQLATNVGLRLRPTTTMQTVVDDFRPFQPLVAAMGQELALRLAHHSS